MAIQFFKNNIIVLHLYRESGVFPPAEGWLSCPAGRGWCRCPTVRPAGLSSGPAEGEGIGSTPLSALEHTGEPAPWKA